jgi:hypothetical protein
MTADLAASLLNRAGTGAELLQILDSIAEDASAQILPMTPAIAAKFQELYPEIQF